MHLCAVATHAERYFPVLLASCKRFGQELEVIGWGKKWTGYHLKLEWMLDYVSRLPEDDVVCFVDAYDVVLLRSPSDLETVFRGSGSQMIVSCDGRAGNFVVQYFIDRIFPRVDGVAINTGAYIAYAGHLRRLLKHLQAASQQFKFGNDQELVATFCRDHAGWIDIDTESQLFLTFYAGSHFSFGSSVQTDISTSQKLQLEIVQLPASAESNGLLTEQVVQSVRNRSTDTCPFVLHAPCDGNINGLLTRLGYTLPAQVLSYGATQHMRYLWRATLLNLPYIYDILVLVILFILVIAYGISRLMRRPRHTQSHHSLRTKI